MPSVSPIRVRFTAVSTKLAKIIPYGLDQELRKYARDFIQEVLEEVREYPPPVPVYTVRYERGGLDRGQPSLAQTGFWPRTNTLYNAWRINPTGLSDRYTLYNNAHEPKGQHRPYATWVHGSSTSGPAQTVFHEDHGWKTTAKALEAIGGREGFGDGLQTRINRRLQQG